MPVHWPIDLEEKPFAIGAVITGVITDMVSIEAAIMLIGILTLISAGIIFIRMDYKDNRTLKLLKFNS